MCSNNELLRLAKSLQRNCYCDDASCEYCELLQIAHELCEEEEVIKVLYPKDKEELIHIIEACELLGVEYQATKYCTEPIYVGPAKMYSVSYEVVIK